MFMNHLDKLFASIIGSVILVHCLLLVLCCFSPFAWIQKPKQKSARQKLVVQTVALVTPSTAFVPEKPKKAAPVKTKIPEPSPNLAVETKSTSIQTHKPVPPKPNPTVTPKPASTPTLKPASKPALKTPEPTQPKITSARQQLLKKAKETLSQAISNTTPSPIKQEQTAASLTVPKLIGELKSESLIAQMDIFSGNSREADYQEELVGRLKSQLQMPEYGSVDIELTLSHTGKVIKFKILREESSRNRHYIEKNIPTMLFSPFGTSFEGKAEFTFAIRLSNAM